MAYTAVYLVGHDHDERDWILGFLNVGIGFISKFLGIHERVGKLGFLNSVYCHILSDCVNGKGGANFWLNYQFLRTWMFIFMQQICVTLNAGNTVYKLKWG